MDDDDDDELDLLEGSFGAMGRAPCTTCSEVRRAVLDCCDRDTDELVLPVDRECFISTPADEGDSETELARGIKEPGVGAELEKETDATSDKENGS